MDWQPRRLQHWLSKHFQVQGQMLVTPVEGGVSNDNYFIDWGHHRWLLRKMPAVLSHQSAHNVLREFRILEALESTSVRAPKTVISCDDRSIIGSPFFIMERINGIVIDRHLPASYGLSSDCVDVMAVDMINVLAALHNLDWRAINLSSIGNSQHYLEQQVGRWLAQYKAHSADTFPSIVVLSNWLRENCPVEQEVVLIHGDYQLANMIVSRQPPARLLAIIDWELSTLGDPLMDLASVLLSWPAKGNTYASSLLSGGRLLRGTDSFKQLAQCYARARGCDISPLNYYLVLSAWKRAIILESRYVSRKKDTAPDQFDKQALAHLKSRIELLLEQASGYITHPVRF